ncbi:hypothetical protein NQ314_014956 [Rhamnusium bicolor]|uniref:Uncharacterized protein n=1 Tax=Rhamnusium bicolor TaxID=1586634 RepID=A0AAV8X0I3_9CUCU|nr:hypothetical protein NQ314_014956 [Rhamnusium bicolor]
MNLANARALQCFPTQKITPPEDIYVRSTDVDRTLMSAACKPGWCLSSKSGQSLETKLAQATHTHSHCTAAERCRSSYEKSCPRNNELYEEIQNAPINQEVNEQYVNLYDHVSTYSGVAT